MTNHPKSSPPDGPNLDPIKRPNPTSVPQDQNSPKKPKLDDSPLLSADEFAKDVPDKKQAAASSSSSSNPFDKKGGCWFNQEQAAARFSSSIQIDEEVWEAAGIKFDETKLREYIGCGGVEVNEKNPLPHGYAPASYLTGAPKVYGVKMFCMGCSEGGKHWTADCPHQSTKTYMNDLYESIVRP